MRVAAHGNAKGAGQTKVGQLELLPVVDEQILRLEVAVQHLVLVAERHTLQQLEQERLDHCQVGLAAATVQILF